MNLVLPGPNYVLGCPIARLGLQFRCEEILEGRKDVGEICDSHVGKAYGICTAQRGSFLRRMLFRGGRFNACLGSCTPVLIA